MNYLALKGEVSGKEKMVLRTSPGLRRSDVVFNINNFQDNIWQLNLRAAVPRSASKQGHSCR